MSNEDPDELTYDQLTWKVLELLQENAALKTEVASLRINQQAQHKITPQCKRYSQCPTASECVSPDLKSCFEAA